MLWLLFCNTFNKGKTQALKGNCCLHCVSRDPLAPIFARWLQWRGGCCGLILSDRTEGAVFPYEAGWGEGNPLEGSTLLSPACSGAQPSSAPALSLRGRARARGAPCRREAQRPAARPWGKGEMAWGERPRAAPLGLTHCPKGCGQAPPER